jgi:phage-related minor tail protein
MPLRAAELEVLFTANTTDIARGEKDVKTAGERIEKKPITAKVDVETKDALAGMASVEQAANRFDTVFDKLAPNDQQKRELIRGFLESDRAAKQSAEQIEKVLSKSYGVAGAAAKQLAAATKGEFKDIESAGKKLGAQDVTIDVEAPTADVLAGMDQVEKAAKKLVNQRTVAVIDADISRAEKAVARTQQKLEELQARALGGLDVTAETRRAEAALQKTQRQLTALTSAREQIEVEADVQDALDGVDKVETATKRLVSNAIAVQVDANVKTAQAAVTRFEAQLAQLSAMEPTTEVRAETYKAEALLDGARKKLQALEGARAQMEVEVDTSGAEQSLDAVADQAGKAGKRGGDDAGEGLVDGIVAALVALPIAGSIVAAGTAVGKAFVGALQEGLQVEVSRDRLQALTGISDVDAQRLGRSASEAYANGFGESIEQNMDLTRLGVQFDIIDPAATTRDSQKVISGLAGIADILEEDVQPVARTTASLLSTGLAKSSQEAFDIFAAGAREGVNRGDDLLDTLNEYSSTFASIGLTGGQALGLLNQGLKAGAPNTDFFADSLRELGIRLREGDDATAGFVERVGLVPANLQAAFAKGGPEAAAALDELFVKLNQIEDPVERNKVAVGLLGTQFEDLQFDVSKIDLSTAEAQMNGVEGAAQRMFDTLASNDASKIEGALRSIEVAGNGVKGALAGAFGDGLGDVATFVSENRGPVLQFLSDMVDGSIDFGQAIIEAVAGGTESLGELVAGPGRDAVLLIANLMHLLGQDTTEIEGLAEDMGAFDEKADTAASNIRRLSGNLEDGRGSFHEFFDPQIDLGFLNDKTMALASAIDAVGYSADGSKIALDGVDLANLSASESGATLEQQVRNSISAMSEEVAAAGAAGESQEQLAGRYDTATNALVGQLVQMGLTEQQARDLIAAINETPGQKGTHFDSNANDERGKVELLGNAIVTLPDGSVIVTADTATATAKIDQFVRDLNNIPGRRDVVINQVVQQTGADRGAVAAAYNARGNILEFMAAGGLPGLTPMQSIAQMVPASTWRVVGDRSDVPELYAPLDGSSRSWALILEGLRRMPGSPPLELMAQGGMAGASSGQASPGLPAITVLVQNPFTGEYLEGRVAHIADGRVAGALDRQDQDSRRRKWRS